MTPRSSLLVSPSVEPPLRIVLAGAGLGAITLIVVGAVGLRGLFAGPGEGDAAQIGAAISAAPSGPPAPVVPAPDAEALTARELRARMARELDAGRYADFIAHLDQLLGVDPTAAGDREIRTAIVDVVLMRIMVGGEQQAAKLFGLLERRMGTTGIDILYELIATRGSSLASKRAAELLRDEAVRARGTPALRIAYELRTAPCEAKRALLDRAATDGDRRSVDQLILLGQQCGRRNRGCCSVPEVELKATMAAIKARQP